MSTTSVEAICCNYRPKKGNIYPIMLRLTKSEKRKYVSLGVSVKEEHRDFIIAIIDKRIAEYMARINEYRLESQDYTLETLVQRTENPVSNTKLFFCSRRTNRVRLLETV